MKCPLCHGDCYRRSDSHSNEISFSCKKYNRSFCVTQSLFSSSEKEQRRINNLIFEYVISKPFCKCNDSEKNWWFFYEPTYIKKESDLTYMINLAEIPYPRDLAEKIDRVLLNLYHMNSSYGYVFDFSDDFGRAFYAETEEEEKSNGLAIIMSDVGYIDYQDDKHCRVLAKGWQRIDELLRNSLSKKQAFLAMAFKPETESIRDAFRRGVAEAGYTALAIDEKEHNNQIVPEILSEIEKSTFLVMDATYPNYGAYYEAGYALGKGKQVIICCKRDAFSSDSRRPHFDIAQKSMIVWDSEQELIEALKRRIEATIE